MASLDTASIRAQINCKSISNKDLLAIYRRVAKTADQRLVRLEALSTQKNFKQVKQWAYKNAARDAAEWGANPNKPRFNIKPPVNKTAGTIEEVLNRTSTRAKINDMLNFLEKPTSTKADIIKIYQQKADTLNEKYKEYNLNLSWSDVGDFFESSLYKKLAKKYSSGTVVKAIATIKNNEEEVLTDFKKHQSSHIKTEDNDIVIDDAIKRMTSYYKADVRKLLKMI